MFLNGEMISDYRKKWGTIAIVGSPIRASIH